MSLTVYFPVKSNSNGVIPRSIAAVPTSTTFYQVCYIAKTHQRVYSINEKYVANSSTCYDHNEK